MNLIDAIKSGLPFKREGHTGWYTQKGFYELSKESLMANDWVVQSKPIVLEMICPRRGDYMGDELVNFFNSHQGSKIRVTCEVLDD